MAIPLHFISGGSGVHWRRKVGEKIKPEVEKELAEFYPADPADGLRPYSSLSSWCWF